MLRQIGGVKRAWPGFQSRGGQGRHGFVSSDWWASACAAGGHSVERPVDEHYRRERAGRVNLWGKHSRTPQSDSRQRGEGDQRQACPQQVPSTGKPPVSAAGLARPYINTGCYPFWSCLLGIVLGKEKGLTKFPS